MKQRLILLIGCSLLATTTFAGEALARSDSKAPPFSVTVQDEETIKPVVFTFQYTADILVPDDIIVEGKVPLAKMQFYLKFARLWFQEYRLQKCSLDRYPWYQNNLFKTYLAYLPRGRLRC